MFYRISKEGNAIMYCPRCDKEVLVDETANVYYCRECGHVIINDTISIKDELCL